MPATLDTFTADGRVVISFAETAVSAKDRDEFLALLKTEWAAKQSQLSESHAQELADEVDASWWSRNRERILREIGQA